MTKQLFLDGEDIWTHSRTSLGVEMMGQVKSDEHFITSFKARSAHGFLSGLFF